MIKSSIDLKESDVEKIVDRMPMSFKLKLVRKLERETYENRWQDIFNDINKRLKNSSLSQKDINDEIKTYRREKHAQGRR